MPEYRAAYTPEEDAVVLSIVNEAKEAGHALEVGYMKAADEIKRPVGSVSNRYRRLISPTPSKKVPKALSESERLALKLKSIKRDGERSAEKVEHYKDKYLALEKEHNKLIKEHETLLSEHENLVKTVKEVLGEDDEGQVAMGEVAAASAKE